MTFRDLANRKAITSDFVSLAVYTSNSNRSRRLNLTIGKTVANLIGASAGSRVAAAIGDPGTCHAGLMAIRILPADAKPQGVKLYINGGKSTGSLSCDLAWGWTKCRELHKATRCIYRWDKEQKTLEITLPVWARGK